MQFGRKKVAATLGVAVLLAGGSQLAMASIPDSDDSEYHACVSGGSGFNTLRSVYMIDKQAGVNCPTGYSEKVWNQKGVKGDTGDVGPAGPQGPAGEPGAAPNRHYAGVRHMVPQGPGQDVFVLEFDNEANVISAGPIMSFAPQGMNALEASTPGFSYTNHGQTTWRFSFKKDPDQEYLVEIQALVEDVN